MERSAVGPRDLFLTHQSGQIAPHGRLGNIQPVAKFLHRQVTMLLDNLSQPLATGLDDVQGNFQGAIL